MAIVLTIVELILLTLYSSWIYISLCWIYISSCFTFWESCYVVMIIVGWIFPHVTLGFINLTTMVYLWSSPMVRETRLQSQVESYQRLQKKWYLMPPCLTLSIIRYVSRVKWSNPGKIVAPSPTSQCSSYWKRSLWVALDYSRQLYLYLWICFWFQTLVTHKWEREKERERERERIFLSIL